MPSTPVFCQGLGMILLLTSSLTSPERYVTSLFSCLADVLKQFQPVPLLSVYGLQMLFY